MAETTDFVGQIEACRTCGIFYLTTSNVLRQIFNNLSDDPEMTLIRVQLLAWKIEINENDGFPQYICTSCLAEFNRLLHFKSLCMEVQKQWQHFYNLRQQNILQIKKEKIDPSEEPNIKEENVCSFIYVDDSSDGEYEGTNGITSFNIPDIQIKKEFIENNGEAENNIKTEESEKVHDVINLNGNFLNDIPASQSNGHDEKPSFPSELEPATEKTQCNLCMHVSSSPEQHRLHMIRIHELRDMDCHICGKQFRHTTSSRLKFHLRWHKISKHIKCVQCGYFCSSRVALKEHTQTMHTKIECNVCGIKIYGKKMKAHMRSHPPEYWPCSYCDNVFDYTNDLETHIWEVHDKEESQQDALAEIHSIHTQNSDDTSSHCDQLRASQDLCQFQNLPCSPEHEFEEQSEENSQGDQFQYSYEPDISCDVFQEPRTENQQLSFVSAKSSAEESTVTHVISSEDEDEESESESQNEVPDEERLSCLESKEGFSSTEEVYTHYNNKMCKQNFVCQFCEKNFRYSFALLRHIEKIHTRRK